MKGGSLNSLDNKINLFFWPSCSTNSIGAVGSKYPWVYKHRISARSSAKAVWS